MESKLKEAFDHIDKVKPEDINSTIEEAAIKDEIEKVISRKDYWVRFLKSLDPSDPIDNDKSIIRYNNKLITLKERLKEIYTKRNAPPAHQPRPLKKQIPKVTSNPQ